MASKDKRWLVTCSGNDKAQSDVISPIKPEFCPMCGQPAKVSEWNAPDKMRGLVPLETGPYDEVYREGIKWLDENG